MTRLSTAQIKALVKTTGQKLPEGILEEERGIACQTANLTLELPIPPTTNHLFITSGRFRRISPKYAAWRVCAGKKLTEQNPHQMKGLVRLEIAIHAGKGFPVDRDLDNCFKAILDLLVTHKVVEADDVRTVLSVYAEYIPNSGKRGEARCIVSIKGV